MAPSWPRTRISGSPAELLAQVQALATKEDKTADELTAEAVKRDIARRMIADLKRESK